MKEIKITIKVAKQIHVRKRENRSLVTGGVSALLALLQRASHAETGKLLDMMSVELTSGGRCILNDEDNQVQCRVGRQGVVIQMQIGCSLSSYCGAVSFFVF